MEYLGNVTCVKNDGIERNKWISYLPIQQSLCISIINDSIKGRFGLSVNDGGRLLPTA